MHTNNLKKWNKIENFPKKKKNNQWGRRATPGLPCSPPKFLGTFKTLEYLLHSLHFLVSRFGSCLSGCFKALPSLSLPSFFPHTNPVTPLRLGKIQVNFFGSQIFQVKMTTFFQYSAWNTKGIVLGKEQGRFFSLIPCFRVSWSTVFGHWHQSHVGSLKLQE